MPLRCVSILLLALVSLDSYGAEAPAGPPEGFVPLFNGKDLDGWTVRQPDNKDWTVVDGVIDCDLHDRVSRTMAVCKIKAGRAVCVVAVFGRGVGVGAWRRGNVGVGRRLRRGA